MKTYTTSTYLRAKEVARTQELCEILQRALEAAAEDEDRVTFDEVRLLQSSGSIYVLLLVRAQSAQDAADRAERVYASALNMMGSGADALVRRQTSLSYAKGYSEGGFKNVEHEERGDGLFECVQEMVSPPEDARRRPSNSLFLRADMAETHSSSTEESKKRRRTFMSRHRTVTERRLERALSRAGAPPADAYRRPLNSFSLKVDMAEDYCLARIVEDHDSFAEEEGKENRRIFTPRAWRIIKSRFGGFAALVAGIVILIPSLFNGGPSNRPPWWWTCLTVAIVLMVVSFVYEVRLSPSREELLADADRFRKQREHWEYELYEVFEVISCKILGGVGSKSSRSRFSVYYHRDRCFVRVCRVSGNPDLGRPGRSSYPDNQGIIAKVWREEAVTVTNMPSDREGWVSACVGDYGMKRSEAQDVAERMQSLSIVGRRINYGHRPIGIILLESTEPLGVNSKTLDKLGSDDSLKVLVEVLTEILHVVRGSFDVDRPQS